MSLKVTAISFTVLLIGVACGAGEPELEPNLPTSGDTYVISGFDVPTTSGQAGDVAVDVDGDGTLDNALMQSFGLIFGTITRDPEAEINESVTNGETLQLLLIGPSDVAGIDGVRVFLGEDVDDDPTNNLTGTGALRVRAGSDRDLASFGAVNGNRFDFRGGEIVLENDFFGRLEIPLQSSSVVGSFAGDGTVRGRLGGAIPVSYADAVLAPAVRDAMVSEVARDCPGTEFPECCIAGSDGEGWLDFFVQFDENPDCILGAAEIEASTGFQIAFAPDIDMNRDGENDSISFGVGFTAVPAIFAVP